MMPICGVPALLGRGAAVHQGLRSSGSGAIGADGLCLHPTVILVGLLRYAHVLERVGPSLLNTLGLAAGWLCAAGLTMVGNFQVRLRGGNGPGWAEMGDGERGREARRPGCVQLLQGVVVAEDTGFGVIPFSLLAPSLISGPCPSLGTGVAPCCGSGLSSSS